MPHGAAKGACAPALVDHAARPATSPALTVVTMGDAVQAIDSAATPANDDAVARHVDRADVAKRNTIGAFVRDLVGERFGVLVSIVG